MTRRLAHLVDDLPVRWRDVGELFRHMLTERARELVTSDDHPKRTATVLAAMQALAGLCLIAAAAATGWGVRALVVPWSDAAEISIGAAFLAVMLAYFVLQFRASRRRPPTAAFGSVPAEAAIVMLPLLFVFQTLLFAILPFDDIGPWWNAILLVLVWWNIATQLMSSLLPGQRLLQEFATLAGAEGQLAMNQRWVEGCHEMIAKGVPSPLEDALAQVGRWTIERDAARERLRTLGYNARFREQNLEPRTSNQTTMQGGSPSD
jgi:hypothetical protein